jgi:hypothetical protein
MDGTEPDNSDELIPCPTATGMCPKCALPIRDKASCGKGEWDGPAGGGPSYTFTCPICGVLSFACGEFDTPVEELVWTALG